MFLKVTTGGNRNNNGSNVGTGPLINGSFRFPVDGGSISWGYGGAHKELILLKIEHVEHKFTL